MLKMEHDARIALGHEEDQIQHGLFGFVSDDVMVSIGKHYTGLKGIYPTTDKKGNSLEEWHYDHLVDHLFTVCDDTKIDTFKMDISSVSSVDEAKALFNTIPIAYHSDNMIWIVNDKTISVIRRIN